MAEHITLQWWRARCKCCQWESKDCSNKRKAEEEFKRHAYKHLVFEGVERKVVYEEPRPRKRQK